MNLRRYRNIEVLQKIISRWLSTNGNSTSSGSAFKGSSQLVSFSDHEAAFRSKRTSELLRAYIILTACTSDVLVDNSLQVLRAGERVGGRAWQTLLRHTLYAQFVAGETGPAVAETTRLLHSRGLRLMVAPALEADVGEEQTTSVGEETLQDRNLNELIHLSQLAGTDKNSIKDSMQPPCLQFKMTALVPTGLLVAMTQEINILLHGSGISYTSMVEKLALIIREGSGSATVFPGLGGDLCLELDRACRRLSTLGAAAAASGVRLLVDMEWSYVNPACSALASALMGITNRREPRVCSTVQCYLKDALSTLQREERTAQELGVCYGAKLVRGAYMERERQVAPHGLCESYEHTGRNYDAVAEAGMLNALRAEEGRHFLVVATHNEAALKRAVALLSARQATRSPNVAFAQIYGMAEHISLPLAAAGFCVYKSVAFGGMSQVLPYLARRAAENRAVVRGSRRERQLLKLEITRRGRAALQL